MATLKLARPPVRPTAATGPTPLEATEVFPGAKPASSMKTAALVGGVLLLALVVMK